MDAIPLMYTYLLVFIGFVLGYLACILLAGAPRDRDTPHDRDTRR